MRNSNQRLSANDNAPIKRRPLRFASNSATKPGPSAPADKVVSEYKSKSALAWAAPVAAILMTAYSLFMDASMQSLIWPTSMMGALLAWTAALAAPQSSLRNVSALLMIGAATLSISGALFLNGFSLLAVEIMVLTSAIALFLGWIFKSRPAVMLSSLSALSYLASLFPELGLFSGLIDELSHIGLALIPILLLGQAVLGQHLRSSAIIIIVLAAGYIWLFAYAKDMPVSALVGIGFALASAHYCLGRAWEARGIFGARTHIAFAALVALIGAFYIQTQWMSANMGQAKPFWPPSNFWWGAFGLAMLSLFIASLMRYKDSQISLVGIFVISLAALILPLATAKPDVVHTVFDYIPGLNANPGLGLVIGATIIAFSLICIVSSLKSGQLLGVLLGAIAIGMQSYVLYQPDYLNMDFGVIFVVSLICALCVGGLIAGSTPNRSQHGQVLA
jgi:hypothetical protein